MDKENHNHECIYKKILDNSYDEIFVLDGKGEIFYVNEACIKHYGLKPSELIGKDVDEIIKKGYWYPSNLIPYSYHTKNNFTAEQSTILGKKIITTTVPVFDDNGEIEMLVQNVRDKTIFGDYSEELKKIRELLERNFSTDQSKIEDDNFDDLITYNVKLKKDIKLLAKAVSMGSTILMLGESGTGKGVLAKHLHKYHNKSDSPLITINCAAIPENLLESELFGYEEGAFSGASKKGKIGLVELARNGILFLDEISEMSPKLQAKLLHVLQDRTYYSVGGTELKKTNTTFISASNKDLKKMVEEGSFREDLYYRLNIIVVNIPPLRNRKEDILPLAYFFLNKYNEKYELKKEFDKACIELMKKYNWPGNIRELENLIERLVIMTEDDIIIKEILPEIFHNSTGVDTESENETFEDFDEAVEEYQRKLITEAYIECKTVRKVGIKLNISRSKAARLINKYIEQ